MRKLSLIALSAILIVSVLRPAARAQSNNSIPISTIRQLLERPAIPFDAHKTRSDSPVRNADGTFSDTAPPKDDAPIDEVITYWAPKSRFITRQTTDSEKPSPVIRQRLLEQFEKYPGVITQFLGLIPDTPEAHATIKHLLDVDKASPIYGPEWDNAVESWLRLNSNLYIGDLVTLASKAKFENNTTRHEEEVRALAEQDWTSAQPVLEMLANGNQSNGLTLANTLLYQHAVDTGDNSMAEKYRTSLIATVENELINPNLRILAAKSLLKTNWDGRDDWLISLIKNNVLWNIDSGLRELSLAGLIATDLDKWIPILTELLDSKDRNVHDYAAASLAEIPPDKTRREALLPLLPWLTNADWADHSKRYGLLRGLAVVHIPESIPGIIWLIANDNEPSIRVQASITIAEYKDPSAVAALRNAIETLTSPYRLPPIIKALIACNGLSETEMVDGLEYFAAMPVKTREERRIEENSDPVPIPFAISIGTYINDQTSVTDSLSRKVLDRANALQQSNQQLARKLRTIAYRWPTHSVDVDIVRRIEAGTADVETIETALNKSAHLREIASDELVALTEQKGINRAIGLVLINDDQGILDVLSKSDSESIETVLACARLSGKSLPVNTVSRLFQKNDDKINVAAERYLDAEDSIEARRRMWSRHPNQAWIAGWKPNSTREISYGAVSIQEVEKKYRDEVTKDGGPETILTLFSTLAPGGAIIRIQNGKAILLLEERGLRYRSRILIDDELRELRQVIANNDLEQAHSNYGGCSDACLLVEVAVIERNKAWRITYPVGDSSPMPPNSLLGLYRFLQGLANSPGIKTHYTLSNEVKGLEVLFSDRKHLVTSVWKKGQESSCSDSGCRPLRISAGIV